MMAVLRRVDRSGEIPTSDAAGRLRACRSSPCSPIDRSPRPIGDTLASGVCDCQPDGKSRGWRSSAGSRVASGLPRTLEYERSAMSSSARNPAGSRKAENWSATMASNPTEMLNPARAEESALSCNACPHSMDSHDALGIRFCAVTSNRSLDRKCICSGEAQTVQHYNRY
ncbi:RGCVC family protein [Rhodococcus sp. SMB37]|uniref:RGCVC family protein n=1 Tax=Rhodococcus sp. SMB37 TaxID=2512213 RepID=UPI00322057B5